MKTVESLIKVGVPHHEEGGCEWLWARPLGPGRAITANIPFYVRVPFGSVVEFFEFDGSGGQERHETLKRFGRLISTSQRTVGILYTRVDGSWQAGFSKVVATFGERGWRVEGQASGCAAVSLPSHVSDDEVSEVLDQCDLVRKFFLFERVCGQ